MYVCVYHDICNSGTVRRLVIGGLLVRFPTPPYQVCKCPPSYFINELLFSLNGEILNNSITCNSIKALFDCIYSNMARECNEHIHKFLKRQITLTNSMACSGFHWTRMYHSQKSTRLCIQSVRQSMLGCGVWCSQYMAQEGLVNKLFLVGRIDSAHISHHDVITDLGLLEELSPYKTLI